MESAFFNAFVLAALFVAVTYWLWDEDDRGGFQ